jgi:hypothetical protein
MGMNKPMAVSAVLSLLLLILFFVLQRNSTFYFEISLGKTNTSDFGVLEASRNLACTDLLFQEGVKLCVNNYQYPSDGTILLKNHAMPILSSSLLAGNVFAFLFFTSAVLFFSVKEDSSKAFQIFIFSALGATTICSLIALGFQIEAKKIYFDNVKLTVTNNLNNNNDDDDNDVKIYYRYLTGFYITIITVALEAVLCLLLYFGFRDKEFYTALRSYI